MRRLFGRTGHTEDLNKNELQSHSRFPGSRTRCHFGNGSESPLEGDGAGKGRPRRKAVQMKKDGNCKVRSTAVGQMKKSSSSATRSKRTFGQLTKHGMLRAVTN